jgi:hypothetical protein
LNFYRRWPFFLFFFIVSRFSLSILHIIFQKLNRLKAPPAPPPVRGCIPNRQWLAKLQLLCYSVM